jgi:hypothetical protein
MFVLQKCSIAEAINAYKNFVRRLKKASKSTSGSYGHGSSSSRSKQVFESLSASSLPEQEFDQTRTLAQLVGDSGPFVRGVPLSSLAFKLTHS